MSWRPFVRDRVVLGSTLVVPMRMIWRSYSGYCDEYGFEKLAPEALVEKVRDLPGVTTFTREYGELRTLARGVGVLGRSQDEKSYGVSAHKSGQPQ